MVLHCRAAVESFSPRPLGVPPLRVLSSHVCVILALLLACANAAPARAGGPIASGATVAGSVSGPTFAESWTFTGATGDEVVLSAVTTSGALNTNITLKAPGGAVATSTSADRIEFTLTSGGTWTIVIDDVGLNDAGTYNLTLLNLSSTLTSAGDPDGGAITSNQIRTGTTNVASDLDAFTFTGAIGDRVLLTAQATSGVAYHTAMYLYPPGGGTYVAVTYGNRIDYQLAGSGTYVLVVQDQITTNTGTYAVSYLNVTAGPLTTGPDLDGGPIASGSIKTGTMSGVGDLDGFTFTGTNGDHVILAALTTSGGLNTNVSLYPPGGAAPIVATSADRVDATLTATGTWTIVVEDYADAEPGGYSLALTDLSGTLTSGSDPDGGPITSNQIVSGTTNVVGDLDAYTFTGAIGDRVVLTAAATSGALYNTSLFLYPPGGGTYVAVSYGDRIDYQLAAGGTYVMVVQDQNLANTGTYAVSYLNVTAGPLTSVSDLDGGPIASGSIKTGTISGVGDLDGFTFTGTNGDHVILAALTTAGALNTNLSLYPPGGGAPIVATSADRVDATLTASGTWTIVVEDYYDTAPGSYSLSLMDLSSTLNSGSDPDGGPITSNQIIPGTTNVVGDMDAFTFTGTNGDRVVLTAATTGGASYNTSLFLYPPGGGTYVAVTNGGRIDYQLTASGTFVLVVQDQILANTGTYAVSFVNVTAGPLTTGPDLDGGPIASGSIKTGTMSGVGDLDGFTFTGTSGDHVILAALTTTGALNTNISLYPPGGGAPIVATSADRVDATLTASGTWTILIEDYADRASGSYSLSLMDLSGTLTSASDSDGGPIASNQIIAGTTDVVGDFDAYTFTGSSGDRVVLTAPETSGASYNTSLYLYPPDGGTYVAITNGDRIDYQLALSGTYVLVVQDQSLSGTGTYAVSYLNVTAGPMTSGPDPDGGPIVSGSIKTGTMSGPGDLDGFTFTGASGEHVILAAVATAGALNTNLSLYPPGGGPPIVATSADRVDATLTMDGTWTIVVEDYSDIAPGSYSLALMDLSSTLTSGSDPDGGPMISNEIHTGSSSVVGDMDAYTFSGAIGERVILTAVATSGASYNTSLYLYPPGGGIYVASSNGDRIDYQLTASGTYVLVVQDQSLAATGTYSVSYLNVIAGPVTNPTDMDGGPIKPGDVKVGQISGLNDLDGYWFTGTAGQTAHLTATTLTGALNTYINIYPPNGGSPVISTSADVVDYLLATTGRYGVVIEDITDNHTGTYQITLTGPLTTVDVPPGGSVPLDPTHVVLTAPRPNPASGNAALTFSLPRSLAVELRVYDVRGALVRTLESGTLSAGTHTRTWDGRDARGQHVSAGVYFSELRAGGETLRKSLVRLD